jgi:prolyl oligopeptidase
MMTNRRTLARWLLCALATALTPMAMSQDKPAAAEDDPHDWLEDVLGDKALAWVRERNAESESLLTARPEYAPIRQQLLEVLNSKDRIPSAVTRRGEWFYNLWRDDLHKRGLWRRTTLDEYRLAGQPGRPCSTSTRWRAEKENWVWGGANASAPTTASLPGLAVARRRRCEGGARVRQRHQAPSSPVASCCPRRSRRRLDRRRHALRRHRFRPGLDDRLGLPAHPQALEARHPAGRGEDGVRGPAQNISVGVSVDTTPGFERTLIVRALDFFRQEHYLLQGDALVALEVPDDARSVSFCTAPACPATRCCSSCAAT